ncbi:MAG: carbohydrate kinase family protein [Desulfomonilaceae bacterium]
MNILVLGSLAYDRIMDFPDKFSNHILPDKIHILNVCFMVNGLRELFGGTAGNIAYNLALLGERPIILACAGKDFDSYEGWLSGFSLPLNAVRRVEHEFTAGAYITTDLSDNQITGFNPGAMKEPCLQDIDQYDPNDTLAIVAPGNIDDMTTYPKLFRQKKLPFIFDPGQSIPALGPEKIVQGLTGSKIFISNDYELEMVMRSTGLSKRDMLERTEAIITTFGENGSLVTNANDEIRITPAPPAKVSDPTGACDAFRAGLIKGLVMGKSFVDAARMGSVSASFGVECQGTQCHRFTLDDFWRRFDSTFSS